MRSPDATPAVRARALVGVPLVALRTRRDRLSGLSDDFDGAAPPPTGPR